MMGTVRRPVGNPNANRVNAVLTVQASSPLAPESALRYAVAP